MPNNEVSLIVRVKDLFTKGLKKAGAGIKRLAGLGKKLGTGLLKGVAIGTTALLGLAAVSKKLIGLYQNQITQEAKRNAVLKATGFAAGKTASELNKEAAALQKLTGIGDEVVISTQAILLTFKQIRGDVFTRATTAIADMGTVMRKAGKDAAEVENGAIQVGKALNDPIKGISQLNRVGVTFTDNQKEQIRTLQESGKIMEAQAIILRELESEFGGAAAEAHKADVGFKDITNTLGDMGEQVGKAIAENDSFKGILDRVNESLQEFADSGQIELWAENIKKALDKIIPVIAKAARFFGKIREGLGRFGRGIGAGVSAVVQRSGEGFTAAFKRGATEGFDAAQQRKEMALEKIKEKKAAEQQAKAEAEIAELEKVRDKRSLAQIAREEKVISLKKRQAELEKEILRTKEEQIKKDAIAGKIAIENAKEAAFAQEAAGAQAEKERLEKQTIAEFVAERAGKKAREKEEEDEAARILRLREKTGRGIKLSRKDREFLEAVAAKEAAFNKQIARNAAALAGQFAAQAEAKRLAAEAAKARNKQIQELEKIKKLLKTNLEAPGG
jgi:hypothetical protein